MRKTNVAIDDLKDWAAYETEQLDAALAAVSNDIFRQHCESSCVDGDGGIG